LKNNLCSIESDILGIFEIIQSIPGQKILTLSFADEVFTIDVDKKGKFGYAKEHFLIFKVKLIRALNVGGGLIIRQFLNIKFEHKAPNGKLMWIPAKKIYAIMLGNNSWQPLSEQQVREIHCTDCQTGKPIESEPGVVFSALTQEVLLDFPQSRL